MKTTKVDYIFCNYKLYKLGLFVGFLYLAISLTIIGYGIVNGVPDESYMVLGISALTVLPSILLIKGIWQNRHSLLLPWLINMVVLFPTNMFFLMDQFGKGNRELTFALFIALELQRMSMHTIYGLYKVAHLKTQIKAEQIKNILQKVIVQANDKASLIENEHVGFEEEMVHEKLKEIEEDKKEEHKENLINTDDLGKEDKVAAV